MMYRLVVRVVLCVMAADAQSVPTAAVAVASAVSFTTAFSMMATSALRADFRTLISVCLSHAVLVTKAQTSFFSICCATCCTTVRNKLKYGAWPYIRIEV